MFKQVLAATALAALAACGGGGGGGGGFAPVAETAKTPEPIKAPERVCTVELRGDSILAGHPERRPAAEIKARRPAWTVIDKTQPGQSLAVMWSNFPNDTRTAKYIVVESGIIDSMALEAIGPNLRAVVDYIKAEGRTPILTGLSRIAVKPEIGFVTEKRIAQRDAADAQAREVAGQTGAGFADWASAEFGGAADLTDDIHPKLDYSMRLAAKLIEALDRAAPECAS